MNKNFQELVEEVIRESTTHSAFRDSSSKTAIAGSISTNSGIYGSAAHGNSAGAPAVGQYTPDSMASFGMKSMAEPSTPHRHHHKSDTDDQALSRPHDASMHHHNHGGRSGRMGGRPGRGSRGGKAAGNKGSKSEWESTEATNVHFVPRPEQHF